LLRPRGADARGQHCGGVLEGEAGVGQVLDVGVLVHPQRLHVVRQEAPRVRRGGVPRPPGPGEALVLDVPRQLAQPQLLQEPGERQKAGLRSDPSKAPQ
jgi:hypothetical protein